MVISLYFHIPFCTKKCPYCHFYVIPNKARFHPLLREGLRLEWEQQKHWIEGKQIASIYFGGGTPSLFGATAIGEILQWIKPPQNCEITIEANPEESSEELFSELRAQGVNRLSLGVQSLDDRSLSVLGRQHDAQKAKWAIFAAERAGFKNISIDLMYDLPDQTESSWISTLGALQDLQVQHISLYNLTIEPHTSFYKKRAQLSLPKPETSLQFLHTALRTFEKLGFERYEISAFAKSGFSSQHNLGYWTFRPFLGFGPSAFSYWNGERFQNVSNLQRYLAALKTNHSPISFREKLPHPQDLKEKLAVGLRVKSGCPMPEGAPEEMHLAVKKLIQTGLLEQGKGKFRLTEQGMLFYDSVATELM